jgi:cytidylate kinase
VPGQDSWADRIVTISAAYGTGGTAIASAVAARLGLPFVDRAIPAGVARSLALPLEAAIARDEHRASLIDRIIMAVAEGGSAFAVSPLPPPQGIGYDEKTFQVQTERVILDQADSGRGGVVLGRAGAIVLAQHHKVALRVRLRGPDHARVAALVDRGGFDEQTATELVQQHDRAIHDYIRHFYKADLDDPSLYHMVIDATAFAFDSCVEIIVSAVQARSVNSSG